jgi:Right handed beta helix region
MGVMTMCKSQTAADRPLARRPRNRRRFLAALALAAIAGVVASCGDDEVSPGPNGEGQGFIAGSAFPQGDAARAPEIKVEIFRHADNEKVSTVFPNDQGRFVSDPIDDGNHYLIASLAVDGYLPARRDNIAVVPGRTTEVGTVDVPDTSSVRFENLTPVPFSLVIERRPVISGDLHSAGAGFKLNTFFLELEGERITDGLLVTEIRERYEAEFAYSPPLNLKPGEYEVRAGLTNQAGVLNDQLWRFRILEGVSRRVPSQYPNVQEAVFVANDGDTILVAGGTHEAQSIRIDEDLVFLSEGGQDATTFTASIDRHFHVDGVTRRVLFRGFTFTGGHVGTNEPGGSILCEDAVLTIEDCTFSGNESDRGGALAFFASSSNIQRCTFVANRAGDGGAIGIYDGGNPLVSHCIFIRNVAAGVASGGLGGAIFVRAASVSIRNSTFLKNDAQEGLGGAVMADSDPTPATVLSEGNLYIENQARVTSGTLHFHQSFVSTVCDGFHANRAATPVAGDGGDPEVEELLEVPASEDPGFCNLPAEDVHLKEDSPFVSKMCPRGPYPPGCKPRPFSRSSF